MRSINCGVRSNDYRLLEMYRAKVIEKREEVIAGQRVIVQVIAPRKIPDLRDTPILSRDDSTSAWQHAKQREHWY
jgi:hypothetical protein